MNESSHYFSDQLEGCCQLANANLLNTRRLNRCREVPCVKQAHISADNRVGLTLIELLVTIVIIACLAGIVLVLLSRVRTSAKFVTCRSNQRQIGYAFQMYTNAHDGTFPLRPEGAPVYEKYLARALKGYISGMFPPCPKAPATDREEYPLDYGLNWDRYSTRRSEEQDFLPRTRRVRPENARYVTYLFDEWRVDQQALSYTWHCPQATLGMNNSINVLYPDLHAQPEKGWDRLGWQLGGAP